MRERPEGRRRSKGRENEPQGGDEESKTRGEGWNVGFAWGFDKEDKKRTRERRMQLERKSNQMCHPHCVFSFSF